MVTRHAYPDATSDSPSVSWVGAETMYHFGGLSAGLVSTYTFDDGYSRKMYVSNPHGDTVAVVFYDVGGAGSLNGTFTDYGDYGDTPINYYSRGVPAAAWATTLPDRTEAG